MARILEIQGGNQRVVVGRNRSLGLPRLAIWSVMASLAISWASSTVRPQVTQPGRAGASAVEPPSGSGLSVMLKR